MQLKLEQLVSILPNDFRETMVSAFSSSTVFTSLLYAAFLGLKEVKSSTKFTIAYYTAFFLFYSFICFKSVRAVNKLATSKVIIYYCTLTLLKTFKKEMR